MSSDARVLICEILITAEERCIGSAAFLYITRMLSQYYDEWLELWMKDSRV